MNPYFQLFFYPIVDFDWIIFLTSKVSEIVLASSIVKNFGTLFLTKLEQEFFEKKIVFQINRIEKHDTVFEVIFGIKNNVLHVSLHFRILHLDHLPQIVLHIKNPFFFYIFGPEIGAKEGVQSRIVENQQIKHFNSVPCLLVDGVF